MTESIMQTEADSCYLCGRRTALEEHHCMAGTANRKLSEMYGLTVRLCHECHLGKRGAQYHIDTARVLKQQAQIAFEKIYGHKKWMDVFRKNYLMGGDEGDVARANIK